MFCTAEGRSRQERPEKGVIMDMKNYSSPLDLKQVRITDEFWGREQELVRKEVIPYQWDALNDRIPDAAPSYCMRNFKVAGRLMKEKREQGTKFVAPAYTYRGFEALPEDPENPDPDKFYGFVFQDSDFAKWIEAVGYSLINHPDPELEKTADEAIDIVCAAQAENGYLDTYYIINGMDRIFTNLRDHHELYCFGHLVEGAVAYYQATGKDKLLKAAERYADFIASRFGYEEGKCKGYPGHEIAEMALARLYEVTGKRKYLDLSKFFLDMRGTKPYYFDIEEKERAEHDGVPYREPNPAEIRHAYHQSHYPVREQNEAVGHAVRAVYLYSGMADVARLTGDEAMFEACERLWNNITGKKLYITGGIGGTHIGEAFSFGYDLPNDTAYSETCAAIGLAFFARRMLEIQADSRYGDVMEQALYNTVLAGMALDGKSFFYVNPLEVWPSACMEGTTKKHVKSVRQKWFGVACCPPNIARTLASLGQYIYGVDEAERRLYVNLFVSNETEVELGSSRKGEKVRVSIETKFPWENRLDIQVAGVPAEGMELLVRIPDYAENYRVRLSGCVPGEKETEAERGTAAGGPSAGAKTESGYWSIPLTGDGVVTVTFEAPPRYVYANPQVRADAGKAAIVCGPLVYCLEERDNGGNLPAIFADTEAPLVKEPSDLFGGCAVIRGKGRRIVENSWPGGLYGGKKPELADTEFTAVPYPYWNNRGEGEMVVWMKCLQ